MDDSCAVCADDLEWVAYGSCGHREVCSTCVVRLRFVLGDSRCCICKTESPFIFVTKALGDYTRTINDFSTFPSEPREGRVGGFWYHEDTQAFFDDLDQYRMIKAMCRLSCSVCDNADVQPREGGGQRHHRMRFKSVEQLKGHLFHKHKLHMCGLCLEGRKVFICEQKLYTRAQLNQHIQTGDSEVDGNESERGGFTGHPLCEFCKNPFYGDNELYTHMSTEHYTCHLCQRLHPGQYEYYKNYDDLEIHFRRDHFLCEDDSCLAKKFIVFQNESELKRHNAIEHGGRMSRSQRSAALQIPTSFRYRRNEQENRRGRARSFRREPGDDDYNHAVHEALRLSEAEYSRQEPAPPPPSAPPGFSENNNRRIDDADPLIQPMESLSTTDMEPSSRYLEAVGSSGAGGTRLREAAFPPLSGQPRPGQNVESLPTNTMAARLRQTNRATVVHAARPSQGWPAVNRGTPQPSNTSGRGNSSSGWPAIGRTPVQASNSSVQSRSSARVSQPRPPNAAVPQVARSENRIPHSSSAPNLSDTRSLQSSHSDFPPVSATAVQNRNTSSTITSSPAQPPTDVKSANKSLVEKMRSALGHDEDLFQGFKDVSGQYRQGSIDANTYLEYVKAYGLSHLVIDLARLCPDPKRQKELIDIHNASLRNVPKENGQAAAQSSSQTKESQWSKKNKGKAVKAVDPKEALAENFMDTVRRLQSSQNAQEEEEEISKDKNTYRSDKGKSIAAGTDSSSAGGKQQRKKTSKFHRVRLGDGSMAALLDLNNSSHEPDPDNSSSNQNQTGGLPVRGVWRKGGANLFS